MRDFCKILFRPSSRAFFREARTAPGVRFMDAVHGYMYSRWPYKYISLATGRDRLFALVQPFLGWFEKIMIRPDAPAETSKNSVRNRPFSSVLTFADTYHGKVVPLDLAGELVTLDQDISLFNLESVLPYQKAKDIVIKNPDHLVALDCPCRLSKPNPCKPVDVCLVVGEPFAGFIREHHPNRSRWIDAEESLSILWQEHARGHVHHAFFKDAMLNRFYAICNCCPCCCGAMQAHQHGIAMLAHSGFRVTVDLSRCKGCGECVKVCPFRACSLQNGKAEIHETVCMGCGVCLSRCPEGVLRLVRDPKRPSPLDLAVLAGEPPFLTNGPRECRLTDG